MQWPSLFVMLSFVRNFEPAICLVQSKVNTIVRNCDFVFSNGHYEELARSAAVFKSCTDQFDKPSLHITLQNYSLSALPSGTFNAVKHLNSFRLDVNESRIALISPLYPEFSVFKELKFDYAVIDISDSSSLSGWKWEDLSLSGNIDMTSFEMNIVRTKLVYLPTTFGKIAKGRVTVLRILNCQLRWLGESVFSSFKRLKSLELRKNVIENVQRSHLPTTAENFSLLDLGDNRLKSIPEDFFEGLQLKNVYLDGNNLKIIDSILEILYKMESPPFIGGVLWPCDCEIIQRIFKTFMDISNEKCSNNGIILPLVVLQTWCPVQKK